MFFISTPALHFHVPKHDAEQTYLNLVALHVSQHVIQVCILVSL